jgi:hypothetical protein
MLGERVAEGLERWSGGAFVGDEGREEVDMMRHVYIDGGRWPAICSGPIIQVRRK